MNQADFILLILAVMLTFLLIPYLGEKLGNSPKLYYYGRFRRIFKYLW